jgi:hypothetical protein
MKLLNYLLAFWLIFGCITPPLLAEEGSGLSTKPVVMIMINEQIWVDNQVIYDYYGNLSKVMNIWTSVSQADTTFTSAFLEKGFKVIGSGVPNTTKGKVSRDDMLKAMEGDDLTSTYVGNYLKADMVIVGQVVARGVTPLINSRQKSARANLNVRAVRVDTGEIVAVTSGQGTAAAIDEISAGVDAIKRAANVAAEELVRLIIEKGS